MIHKIAFEQDLELERCVGAPKNKKPRFDWSSVISETDRHYPRVMVETESSVRPFDLLEIAETIGSALTDLMLSREEDDIFTEENQKFVATVSRSVVDELAEQIDSGQLLDISGHDLHLLIEKALVESDAYDVAKSLVFGREKRSDAEDDFSASIRLIRGNDHTVLWGWDESKIEIAVRKAFLSLHLDSSPAVDIARAVTDRLNEGGQVFIDIEDVQDAVQEEIMRQGHFKVAEAYILYRAYRAIFGTRNPR